MKTRRQKISDDRQSISRRNSRSPTLVNGGGSSEFIPIDLIIEILSRSPVKFIARCRCVSKHWASTILRPDFTDLILTRSATTRPQLLFACEKDGEVFFYSSPQPQNPNEELSPVAANCHMSFPLNNDELNSTKILNSVHGLVCLKQIRILNGRKDTVLVICNPSTGQSLTLPRVKTRRVNVRSFFGYDPIGKQFKLLSMTRPKYERNNVSEEHQILTLGNGKLLWRMIECSIPHYPLCDGICINGVLYYQAKVRGFQGKFMIACFDIRSEKFKLIKEEDNVDKVKRGMLVNHGGKLATVRTNKYGGGLFVECRSFELCVLEDAEKHEWSTHKYVLPPSSPDVMYITGVTRTGEIVMSPYDPSDPFYLLFYNLKSNTFIKVEIRGIDASEYYKVHIFLDHVEDVKLGGVFKTS